MPVICSPGRLVFVVMLSCMLAACQTAQRRNPFWQPQRYLFEVSAMADQTAPNRLHPEVSGGKGKGALMGAGEGFSSCAEGLPGGAGDLGPIAILLVLMLPVCAAVGGVAGAVATPSVKAVDEHVAGSEKSLTIHAPREVVAQKIAAAVGAHAAYDPDKHRLVAQQGAAPNYLDPALLKLIVVDVGLVGKGTNPDLQLTAKLLVCGFNETGAMMIAHEWQVQAGSGRKLRSWDSTNAQRWNREVDSLVSAAVKQINNSVQLGGITVDLRAVGGAMPNPVASHPCLQVAPPRVPPGQYRVPPVPAAVSEQ